MSTRWLPDARPRSVYEFNVRDIMGKPVSMRELCEGKVVLAVNVASACGLTPQYEALQNLYNTYKDKGFLIVGFPCNQFGGQEPGTEEEINTFACTKYKVTFPLMAKVEVNGSGADALWDYMKTEQRGLLGTSGIKWNFTKFLIDRQGKVVQRFGPTDDPKGFESAIAKLL